MLINRLAQDDVLLVVLLVILRLAVVEDLGVHPVREAHEEAPDAVRDVNALVIELS